MRKFIIISILFLCFGQKINAQETSIIDKLEFGIEWGYSQNIYNKFSYTILSAAEGYKLKDSGSGLSLYPHLNFNLTCSYIINDYLSTSLVLGTLGIGKKTSIFPIMLRLSYYYNSVNADSFYSFLQTGYGFRKPSGFIEDEAFLLCAGEAYRIILSTRCSLEFLLQVVYSYNKPQIPNPDGPGFVSSRYILSNSAENLALNLSIAFKF